MGERRAGLNLLRRRQEEASPRAPPADFVRSSYRLVARRLLRRFRIIQSRSYVRFTLLLLLATGYSSSDGPWDTPAKFPRMGGDVLGTWI